MRGGAIPILAWGTLLLVLFAINWVWEGRLIQVGATTFAILAVYGSALAVWRRARREAIRRGPPPPSNEPEALPAASTAAAISGLALGCILFGLVWAQFLVYFGIAVLLLALGRTALELRAQRRAREGAVEARQS